MVMDDATVRQLNAINQEFYRVTADDFDRTRQRAWSGWKRLLPHLEAPLTVLDVGCGNGRLALFLAQHFEHGVHYHGVDSSPALLRHARTALSACAGLAFELEARDVLTNPPDTGRYDFVALFGVLHHVPGAANRLHLMRHLAQRVAPGGILAFTGWRFYEYARFRRRVVPWPEALQVEPHDYLLEWRQGKIARRYCHYVTDDEHAALTTVTDLREIVSFRADGPDGRANRYSVLRRQVGSIVNA